MQIRGKQGTHKLWFMVAFGPALCFSFGHKYDNKGDTNILAKRPVTVWDFCLVVSAQAVSELSQVKKTPQSTLQKYLVHAGMQLLFSFLDGPFT